MSAHCWVCGGEHDPDDACLSAAHGAGLTTRNPDDDFEGADDDGGRPGPVFTAAHEGYCSWCGGSIDEGDHIRADGSGSWEHERSADGEDCAL